MPDIHPSSTDAMDLQIFVAKLQENLMGSMGAQARGDEAAVVKAEVECFGLFNAPDLGFLHSKAEFADAIRGLGYLAPSTMVLRKESDELTSTETAARIAELDPVNPTRFCKPLVGSHGFGSFTESSPEVILDRISQSGKSYLVQEYLAGEEWRYMLHRPVDSTVENGPFVRLAYKKLPLGERGEDGRITEENVMPGDEELAEMDEFMAGLAGDISERWSVPFNVVCFDLAVLDDGAIALYETQYPFEADGYKEALATTGVQEDGLDRLSLSACLSGIKTNRLSLTQQIHPAQPQTPKHPRG